MGVLGYAVLGHTVLGQPEGSGSGGSGTGGVFGRPPTRYHLGDVVILGWSVTDIDDEPADPGGYTVIVRHENGATDTITSSVTHPDTGTYIVGYTPTLTGRYVATFTATGDYAGVATVVFDVDPISLAFISTDDLRGYLGAVSASDGELDAALVAERAAQAQRCRIDPYTHELREALMRRVARNLAARAVPVASFTSFDGGATSTRVPTSDPEVKRLEAPYRRLTVG